MGSLSSASPGMKQRKKGRCPHKGLCGCLIYLSVSRFLLCCLLLICSPFVRAVAAFLPPAPPLCPPLSSPVPLLCVPWCSFRKSISASSSSLPESLLRKRAKYLFQKEEKKLQQPEINYRHHKEFSCNTIRSWACVRHTDYTCWLAHVIF